MSLLSRNGDVAPCQCSRCGHWLEPAPTKFLVRGLWRVRDMYWLQAPGMRRYLCERSSSTVSDRGARVVRIRPQLYRWFELSHQEAEIFSTPRKAARAPLSLSPCGETRGVATLWAIHHQMHVVMIAAGPWSIL